MRPRSEVDAPQHGIMREFLEKLNESRLNGYFACPRDIREHAGKEVAVSAGGYGYRQILELVQNGADAILEAHQNGSVNGQARIEVRLTDTHLYVANTGAPLSEPGLEALLSSDLSPKRGNEIGRFGLGFKSLLRLGGRIDLFTSANGSIRFDPEACRRKLLEMFGIADAPGLRLAWPLERSARIGDTELESLSWAETIVRAEIRALGLHDHLAEEIKAFPHEFLLFLDYPVELLLATSQKEETLLRVEHHGDVKVLHAGNERTTWRVFTRDVQVDAQEAVTDATIIHARTTIPLAWATPVDSKREEAGRFWAFFPTNTPTYLPGILNAPWKLNSDRNSLVRGEWNTFLMREAAGLFIEHLPSLSAPEDPGRHLDAFPRQLDRQDEDAVPMISAIWQALMESDVIPDATATLRSARKLLRPPSDDYSLAKQWQELAPALSKSKFVHSSCFERKRGSRLNALADRLRPKQPVPAEVLLARVHASRWFAHVASTDFVQAREVLFLAQSFQKSCSGQSWQEVMPTLSVIPTSGGELASAGEVIIVPDGAPAPEGRKAVHSSLESDPEAFTILSEIFQVGGLDDLTWKRILTESLPTCFYGDAEWERFWANLRLAPDAVAKRFITNKRTEIKVRVRSGTWRDSHEVLLPGEIIRKDDASACADILVDENAHATDGVFLSGLGVKDCPSLTENRRRFPELSEWLDHWREHYKKTCSSRPRLHYLNPKSLELPIATSFLTRISGSANARLTEKLLPFLEPCPATSTFGHDTSDEYPIIEVAHPLPWLILRFGTVFIGSKPATLKAYIHRISECESALAFLPELIPKISPASIRRLKSHMEPFCTPSQEEVQNLWLVCIEALTTPARVADGSLSQLWSAAAADDVIPNNLPTLSGAIPISAVLVTTSRDLAKRLRNETRLVVTLDEHALLLWQRQGARLLSELLSPEWDSSTGPDLLLRDAIPELDCVLTQEAIQNARCQPVNGLRLVVGECRDTIPCLMWEDRLLIDLTQFGALSRHDRFASLLDELALVGWLTVAKVEALSCISNTELETRRAAIAVAPDLPARLLLAIENRFEFLRAALGDLGNQPFVQDRTLRELAELVLAHHGPATLSHMRDALEKSGLQPPNRWNTAEARAFVTQIGFPKEFADASATRREPEEWVSGPIALPVLHDFQEEVLAGIKTLLESGEARRRAVVSLPTGGGKTRVTVESAVRLVLAPLGGRRSVIWIAQSDELCEQAVQAFRQVWVNLGAQSTDLRIVRLWGGNPNPTQQETDKPLVIVASIQTLNARMSGVSLDWLQHPGLVVVDECHHAITPSYTNLLRWLDAGARLSAATVRDEPPFLGLSATPFRMDDDESRRLAARFGNLWFPSDQAELHLRLRKQGVLAEVDTEALRSPSGLTEEEERQFDLHVDQPDGINFDRMLEALNQRLAGVEDRNQQILDCIEQSHNRSILLFANSIRHAGELSARLNLMGIPSAAVSGDTPRISRRYFLERFQKGDLRVLCNHSVLSTGFDAPRIDMLLITRTIFSPVRYMQIVGRGLRGEKNGGTPRCRIVTVLDNLGRFENRHPYHYCVGYFRALDHDARQAIET